jgi:hypothetical protein
VRDEDDNIAHLSDEERQKLAEKIVDVAATRVYAEIGKSVVKKLIWGVIIGAIVAGVMLGIIKIPH